ncbi:ATP-dependent RecD-like DNA helicase [Paenibacillus montaniterrae]|uniref:ATP-dependent RecD-like DNA helicase n=1 Tax=Paenibacillus montaniterrae TaxID=429341 RepID=A0A919YS37_9BACL|nr:AAA family ATPase [Paenibacillus montaniterrae]GIP19667.1 ATP-dependent RecD-like DNA helicase [Paenibacillus montaniterrae]
MLGASSLKKRMPEWLKTMETNELVKRAVTIFEELVYDEESSYGAYVCMEADKQAFVISGTIPFRLKQEVSYQIEGKVALYKGMKQIKVSAVYTSRPVTLEGIILLLQSLDGLDKRAHTLAAHFGEAVMDVVVEQPARVAAELAGVSLRQAEAWSQQLKLLGGNFDVLAKLQSWGIGLNQARKLIAELGQQVDQLIEKNPYLLSKRVRGFGFRRCDRIAMQLGLDMRSRSRMLAAIRYILREASYDGHCFIEREALIDKVKATLNISSASGLNGADHDGQAVNAIAVSFKRAELSQLLEQCVQRGKLVEEQDRIYLPELYEAELKTAAQILRIMLHPAQRFETAAADAAAYLQEKQLHLERKQLEAVIQFSEQSGGIHILNGSAGCGKTFTLNIILDLLELQYKQRGLPFEVKLFAPTGKAAKVASKATGRPCTTIHRGLSYNPERGFEYNEQNRLPVDCIVLDESSMLDMMLAKHLLCALPEHCKVILLGDTKQLPSVGAGNVLHDLIASGMIPVVTLDVVKRQGKDSGIIANANSIIQGRMIAEQAPTGDAFVIAQPSAARMQTAVLRSIARLIEAHGYSLEEIQVLCPQRKGEAGTYVMNWLIQQAFNEQQPMLKVENCKFAKQNAEEEQSEQLTLYFMPGDKVIHTVNNYSKIWYSKDESGAYIENKKLLGITNGECGVIEDICIEEAEQGERAVVIVRYEDGYVKYADGLDELDHCYAMTVHKSQGSQWKAVILIVMPEHAHMLNNSILYTGYTRAQQFVCVIGQPRAIELAITNFKHTKRNSSLKQRFTASEQ